MINFKRSKSSYSQGGFAWEPFRGCVPGLASSRGGSELRRRGDGGQWQSHLISNGGEKNGKAFVRFWGLFLARVPQMCSLLAMHLQSWFNIPFSGPPSRRANTGLQAATPPQSAQEILVTFGGCDAKSVPWYHVSLFPLLRFPQI